MSSSLACAHTQTKASHLPFIRLDRFPHSNRQHNICVKFRIEKTNDNNIWSAQIASYSFIHQHMVRTELYLCHQYVHKLNVNIYQSTKLKFKLFDCFKIELQQSHLFLLLLCSLRVDFERSHFSWFRVDGGGCVRASNKQN